MIPGAQDVPALFVGQEAPEGQSARDALGEGHHIRLDAELLESEHGPRPSDAGLDLVHQQQPVLLSAQLCHRLHVVLPEGIDAALTLDQLHHHAADIVPGGLHEAVHVIGLRVLEALGEGEEELVKMVLPGGLQRGDGPPVEGIFQSNDGGPALAVLLIGVFPGGFNHTLIGLRAGVAEESRRHPGGGDQPGGQPGVRLGVEQIGDVPHLHCLIVNGLCPGLVGVPQGADADSGCKVNILFTLCVPEACALAVVNGDLISAICLEDIALIQCLDVLEIHQKFTPYPCHIITRSSSQSPRGTGPRSGSSGGYARPECASSGRRS